MDHGSWVVDLRVGFAVLDGVIWCWVGYALWCWVADGVIWCWVASAGFGDGETETRDERQRKES